MFEDSSLFVLIAAFAGITLLFIFLYFVPVNLSSFQMFGLGLAS